VNGTALLTGANGTAAVQNATAAATGKAKKAKKAKKEKKAKGKKGKGKASNN
jgi:hypothetical protein